MIFKSNVHMYVSTYVLNFLTVLRGKITGYSYLPNIRTGPNNHTGWKKYEISIIVQVVINVQVGIFPRY